ncbi:enoyl-CoA delta isomerase 1, mitochondrial-like [Onthophagus taurus]|uniref:enoyl-CoA delta isomerase 1, mitochondrial-like n=1 Tax=Onthophagus taurus TaxID=166361 RepID=UPI0039BE78F7
MALRSFIRPFQNRLLFSRTYSGSNNAVNVTIDNNKIATITMNKKPINVLTAAFLTEINDAFKNLEGKVKGAILTSGLPTVFSGGLDINVMYKPEKQNVATLWSTLQEVWVTLLSTSYPTVAVINGNSPAGGCLLSMCCEYRIMVDNFIIGMNETKLGLVPPFWVRDVMRCLIGYRETELALTTGILFTTEEAFKIGLVNEKTTNKEEALSKAIKFFERFNNVNPMARQLTKMSLHQDIIANLRKKQLQDTNEFVSFICQDSIQKVIESYLEALQKKKAKK